MFLTPNPITRNPITRIYEFRALLHGKSVEPPLRIFRLLEPKSRLLVPRSRVLAPKFKTARTEIQTTRTEIQTTRTEMQIARTEIPTTQTDRTEMQMLPPHCDSDTHQNRIEFGLFAPNSNAIQTATIHTT